MEIGSGNPVVNPARLPQAAATSGPRAAVASEAGPAADGGGEPSLARDSVAGALGGQSPQAASRMSLGDWGDLPAAPMNAESGGADGGVWSDPISTPIWEVEVETPPTVVEPDPPPPLPPVTGQWEVEWPQPDPLPEAPEPLPEPVSEVWSDEPIDLPDPYPPVPQDDPIWSDDPIPALEPDKPRDTIRGGSFQSWGDPHETTGDGKKFDNYKVGTFVAFRSAEGDLELQKRQARLTDKEHGIFNVEAGLKVGSNQISYDAASNRLTINGKRVSVKPGKSYTLPDGTKVRVGVSRNRHGDRVPGQPAISVVSPKGDRINILDQGKSLNFDGRISNQRESGSVYGSLGTFDSDNKAGNDMRLPNGQVTQNVDAFLEAWRVRGGDKLM